MFTAAAVIAAAVFFIIGAGGRSIPAAAPGDISGATNEQRLAFLEHYGWSVPEEPVSVEEIFIPQQFGAVYDTYNAIQISQGFDLLPYAGRPVKKWVYSVSNYPGYADSAVYVRATLLIYSGRIIGGDICSVALDGFMHGFAYAPESNTFE